MLNWGIIGAGGIARVFCNGMRFSKTGRIAAIASRSKERADRLADPFLIPKRYRGYEPLLADEQIDAVYICTVNPAHLEWAIKAVREAEAIAQAVEGPITSVITASALQMHLDATVIVDDEAASGLTMRDYYEFIYAAKPAAPRF